MVDIKTGSIPTTSSLRNGTKPQLPLAGWLASTPAMPVTGAAFWHMRGVGPKPLKPVTYSGASWETIMAEAAPGATATIKALTHNNPWPAWPDTEGGGFQASGHCTHCSFAGICRFQEWVA